VFANKCVLVIPTVRTECRALPRKFVNCIIPQKPGKMGLAVENGSKMVKFAIFERFSGAHARYFVAEYLASATEYLVSATNNLVSATENLASGVNNLECRANNLDCEAENP
jgi:hypothetical protein